MKTHEEVLQVLGDLSPADRLWIVDRLSPSARGALLNGVSGQPNSNQTHSNQSNSIANGKSPAPVATLPPVEPARKSDPVSDLLDAADARQIAGALMREPAWVVHAALTRNRPWKAELRSLLPSMMLSDIEDLERSQARYSDKIIASIESELASQLASTPVMQPGTWFDNFKNGLRTRIANRRLRFGA